MTKEQFISLWIGNALTKTKNVNKKASSSYGLKHYCEEAIGEYVSNEEMKEAMLKSGFIADKRLLNWNFNISKKVNKVTFKNRFSNFYNNSGRVFNGINIFIDNEL